MTNNEPKISKVSLLTISAYLSLIIAIVLFAVRASIEPEIEKNTSSLLLLLTSFLILACLLFSLAKQIRQSFSKSTQRQSHHALLLSWISGLLLFLNIGFLGMTSVGTSLLRYQIDLYGFGTAFQVYFNDYDDFYPPADNWCDLLITETDMPAKYFAISTDSITGESSLALNKNVIGKKDSEIPNNMVILFETNLGKTKAPRNFPLKNRPSYGTFLEEIQPNKQNTLVYKDRWNQSGSIEEVAFDNLNQPGTHVLFADGHAEWVPLEEIPKLKWTIDGEVDLPPDLAKAIDKLDDTGIIPQPYRPLLNSIAVAIITTLSLYFIARHHKYFKRFWKLALFLAILSGVAGAALGGMAQGLYYPAITKGEGVLFGFIFCALAGLSYATMSAHSCQKISDSTKITDFTISLGVITGIICSSMVHLCLMIISLTKAPYELAFAIPFGIVAGAILGAITAAVIKQYYYKEMKTVQAVETDRTGGE